jgi:hypothetical protein
MSNARTRYRVESTANCPSGPWVVTDAELAERLSRDGHRVTAVTEVTT